jgi:dethiobiotin synthetase
MTTTVITGSGTEVGKTFLACLLIRQLRARGNTVEALKPVVTGFDPNDAPASDCGQLLSALGLPVDQERLDHVSPWRFSAPLSPDMAAAREQRNIPFTELVEYCRGVDTADVALIEGIGGVLVPLDRDHTVADWIVALEAPVILVTGSYLGTISHTLSAVEALVSRGVSIRHVVISESIDQPVPAKETATVIERFCGAIPVFILPRLAAANSAPNLLPLID